MRTSEQIKLEIEEKLGFFPPFFQSALQNPIVLENLWQQTLVAYLNNPLSPLLKEKISAYLSRYCPVPYCLINHSCSLQPLGMNGTAVLQMLESRPPTQAEIDKHLVLLAGQSRNLTNLSQLDSAIEDSLLTCSIFIFLGFDHTGHYQYELRRILGTVNYQHIVTFVAYVKTCHIWMEAHPETSYRTDNRVQQYLGSLVKEEPRLMDFFDNYNEQVRHERQTQAERLAEMAERQRNHEAIKQSEDRFRNLVEQTNDWVWEIDNQGLFTYVNPQVYKLLGYHPDEVLGKTTCDFMMPDEAQRFIRLLDNFISKQEPFTNIEKILIHQKGYPLIFETSGSPIIDDQGVLQGYRGIARDITQRKKIEQNIYKAWLKEKELNELKSRFVSMTSHEFRTPLSTILSSTELLEHYGHKWNEEKKNQHLNKIKSAVQHLTQLLDDILLLNKVEAKELSFKPVLVDILPLCQELIEDLQLAVNNKHSLYFINHGSCSQGYLDEKLLRSILSNLLSNAIKYSPPNKPILLELNCKNSEVIFQVKDEGIGIPLEEQQQIFESFYRGTNVGTTPGTGLGLTIVKQCVDLHRGTITISSQAGVGTTFRVMLPLTIDNDSVPVTELLDPALLTIPIHSPDELKEHHAKFLDTNYSV